MNGRRVFIKKGESVDEAIHRSVGGGAAGDDEVAADRVLKDIKKRRQLEDLGEYDPDMLRDMYKISDSAAKRLHDKIQAEFHPKDQIRVDRKTDGKFHWRVNDRSGSADSEKDAIQAARTAYDGQKAKKHSDDEVQVVRTYEARTYVNLKGVEIFATGTHNGDPYTEKDLDDIAAAHKDLDFKPAIKVGHTKDFPGAPAYGFVENVRRIGQKLIADFTEMDDTVADAIKKRAYDRVSSEIYFNLNRGGKQFRRALKAVALLGAEVPAVAGLKPLHQMQFSEDGFDRVALATDVLLSDTDSLTAALAHRVEGLINLVKEYSMKTAAQVKKDLDTAKSELEALRAKDANDPKIATLSATIAGLEGEVRVYEQMEARDQAAAAENTALRATVAMLSQKDRDREVKDRVATLTVPAFKPYFEALFAYGLANDTKVKVYSTKDGKTEERELSIPDVASELIGAINAAASKIFVVQDDKSGIRTRKEGAAAGPAAGEDLDKLTREYLVAHPELKGDYAAAFEQVCLENPEAAKAYAEAQNPRFS